VHPGPSGSLLDALKETLNPWLGDPKCHLSEGRAAAYVMNQFMPRIPGEPWQGGKS